MADVHGKFVWHELMNTDPQAVASFYNRVLGWKSQAWDKDPTYTVWMGGKGPAGGAMRNTDSSAPRWLAYTGVAEINAAVATAQRLGGRVVKGVSDIPGGGQYAVLADPQGAHFGVFTPSANAPSGSNMAEAFSWHELGTTDHVAALRFYRELFGWEQLEAHDMGPMGLYVLFGQDGKQLGGMFNRPASTPGEPSWLAYVSVADASKAADAAKASGGRILNGPHEVPGGSWIVQMLDPLGAMIAVVEPPRPAAAKPVEKPKAAAAKAPSSAASAGRTAATPAARTPAKVAKKAKQAQKAAKMPARKPTRKSAKKRVKKAAKRAKKSRTPAKRKSALTRATAAVKRVARRVLRKRKSAGSRRRR
jgi:uncharacterized protein